MINFFKKVRVKKNELSFIYSYIHYGNYSNDNILKPKYLEFILNKFKKNVNVNDLNIQIESKFNDEYYAFFDLDDDQEKLKLFKDLYNDMSYAIFHSSSDHYWAILDKPYKNIKDIFSNANWKICNDTKYVNFSFNHKKLIMRGSYESKERKPVLYETYGILSKNFQLFIDKLYYYYNNEGLELSVIKYKNHELLIQYNRKLKLQQINKVAN